MNTLQKYFISLKDQLIEEIIYRKFESNDRDMLVFMMLSLYSEYSDHVTMNVNKIESTIHSLQSDPEKGIILILEYQLKIVVYCLLINYWSNELGGNILFIDELFIIPDYRSKGIATGLITGLIAMKINDFVALQLEVAPKNISAVRLYKKIGFKPVFNTHMRFVPD